MLQDLIRKNNVTEEDVPRVVVHKNWVKSKMTKIRVSFSDTLYNKKNQILNVNNDYSYILCHTEQSTARNSQGQHLQPALVLPQENSSKTTACLGTVTQSKFKKYDKKLFFSSSPRSNFHLRVRCG